jgi:hypothetical protein
MIYPAKRDWWIAGLLVLISLIQLGGACLFVGVYFWKQVPHLWVAGLILGNVAALLLWILIGTRYEIGEQDLLIRLGPMRWRLAIGSIVEIYSTHRLRHDIGWGLALSLDRLRIKCSDRWLPFWISPQNKFDFIAELQRANPQVQVIQD